MQWTRKAIFILRYVPHLIYLYEDGTKRWERRKDMLADLDKVIHEAHIEAMTVLTQTIRDLAKCQPVTCNQGDWPFVKIAMEMQRDFWAQYGDPRAAFVNAELVRLQETHQNN